MTVFVAGGSGTIGVPLVRALVAAGYRVFATTRAGEKQAVIRGLGAMPVVVVDALDAQALERAVREAEPTHVVHQLTALPKAGPRRAGDLAPTNRLREEGTRHLLRAAIAAGARRIIVGSFAPLGAAAGQESDPMLGPAAVATRSMESQVLDAARHGHIEGIVLRYGMFYGPDNPATGEMLALVRRRRLPIVRDDRGRLPFIHLDDAVAATMAALYRGQSGAAYDIVDDQPASFSDVVAELARIAGAPSPFAVPAWLPRLVAPYMARMLATDLHLSNEKARRELGWAPVYPSYREGLRHTVADAA